MSGESTEAGVEALAKAINEAEDSGKTTPTYTEMARHLLASDWLAAHDAATADRVRRETAEGIAAAIEAQSSCGVLHRGHDGCYVADSLRIAREQAR